MYGTYGDGAAYGDIRPPLSVSVPMSGGVTFWGEATVRTNPLVSYAGSGGASFSGAAVFSRGWEFLPAGGVTFGGFAALSRRWEYLPSGGVTFAGAATASYQPVLPVIITKREFVALMRFVGYNYGSVETYRSAVWHDPLIVELPQPDESLRDEFGIQSGDTIEVTVADTTLRATLEGGTLDGASVVIEWVTTTHYTTGDPIETVRARTYTVKGYTYRSGTVTLRLVNIEDVRLSALYPDKVFSATDWPEIFPEHIGRAVPIAVGTAVKIPCTLIQTNSGAGPWLFAICISPVTVLTVYRSGRVVDSGEYTVSTATSGGYTVKTLSFAAEQVDFSGNLHVIESDVTASNSSNAVIELERILTAAGVTIDATTFAAAETVASSNVMRVDLAYSEQREYSAIIFDLLHVCRASLKRNGVGEYEIVQDTTQSVSYSYDEVAGDLIQLSEYNSADAPATFTLAYRPNIADPNKLQHLISRSAGGVSGSEHLDAPMVRDHEAADRMSCYMARRRQYGATARAQVLVDNIELGQVLAITSTSFWSGAKSWKVKGIRMADLARDVELQQYNTNVYTYVSQTYPSDATTGYSPDYSATPPAVPTSVTVVSGGVALNTDGVAQSYALVKSTPPTVNWKEVWFLITNTVTNEIYQGLGVDNGDGTYGTKIAGLRPNVAHTLVSWAANAFNVKGVVSSTVPFTSTAWTSAPAAATGLTSIQGTGKQVQVKWTAASGTNIAGYDVYRKIGAGSYSVVATVTGTSYPDSNVSYGSTYTYKLVTKDRAGNQSADSGTTAITPAVNVDTPDLVDGGVTTAKRQNMNSQSFGYTLAAGELSSHEFTHSLGKKPIAVGVSDNGSVAIWIYACTTTTISYTLYNTSAFVVGGTLVVYYW